MSLKFDEAALKAIRAKGIKPTKEMLNSVVASMRISGVDANNEKAVTASASVAVESALKFDFSKLLKKTPVAQQEPKAQLNFCGVACPRCGKPMIYANILNRQVGYCTNGCAIAVPFPVEN